MQSPIRHAVAQCLRHFARGARACVRLATLVVFAASPGARAGIDHRVTPADSGIWARKYTQALQYGVIATELGGALWLGGESEPGHTFWQTIDSTLFSAAAAQGMKWAFGRERPIPGQQPQ